MRIGAGLRRRRFRWHRHRRWCADSQPERRDPVRHQHRTPSYSVCKPELPCDSKDFNPFGALSGGDPAAAKNVLQDAGKMLPTAITVVYRKTAPRDASLAALRQTRDQAGFTVTLDGVARSGYYRTISAVAQKSKFPDTTPTATIAVR